MSALDIAAYSGIAGSVSIACWVVVFSPQIIENFRRSSAEGLSIVFIVVWLLGDVFNILGAVLQGVLPTMIILALYYTIADIVLLIQCFYYRGFTLSDKVQPASHDSESAVDDTAPLLARPDSLHSDDPSSALRHYDSSGGRRRSSDAIREHLASLDGVHFSPATPLHGPTRDTKALAGESPVQTASSKLRVCFYNTVLVLLVCCAGVLGWIITNHAAYTERDRKRHGNIPKKHKDDEALDFNVLAQVFGYICAVLYLGSRVPQLLLNYRRKSTDGLSILFFVFACIGNAAYVVSIFLYEPPCVHRSGKHAGCAPGEQDATYTKYILVNLSWIIGSLGTLVLDAGVFLQYFIYSAPKANGS